MAKKNGGVRGVGAEDVRSALEALRAFIVKAMTGGPEGKALFARFKVNPEINSGHIKSALSLFRSGDFTGAMDEIKQASYRLHSNLKWYCMKSPEVFFGPQMAHLEKRGLDIDIIEGLRKKYESFGEYVRTAKTAPSFDLEEASQRYWSLFNSMEAAPLEQQARDRNRAKKRLEEENARLEAEKAEARKRQAERDAELRAEREVLADEEESQFDSLFN